MERLYGSLTQVEYDACMDKLAELLFRTLIYGEETSSLVARIKKLWEMGKEKNPVFDGFPDPHKQHKQPKKDYSQEDAKFDKYLLELEQKDARERKEFNEWCIANGFDPLDKDFVATEENSNDDNIENKIMDLFLAGDSDRKVAKALNLDLQFVRDTISKTHYITSRKPRTFTLDVYDVEDRARTMTSGELAEHYGVEFGVMRAYLNNHRIKAKPMKKGRKFGSKNKCDSKITAKTNQIIADMMAFVSDDKPIPFQSIATNYGVSRQRVHQIYHMYILKDCTLTKPGYKK